VNVALLPLLIIALLMTSVDDDGGGAGRVEVLLSGEHRITDHDAALIVGDAELTVPAGAQIAGPLQVIGGRTVIEGSVAGDVTQFSGELVIAEGGTVGGELRTIGGAAQVADGAAIGSRSVIDLAPQDRGVAASLVPLVAMAGLLAAVGARLARTRPVALENVGSAVTSHPVVSVTVGALVTVTALSLFVFMAFTLVLIPIAVLGLLVGAASLAYGIIVVGHLVGDRIPVASAQAKTALGAATTVLALAVLETVPLVGDVIAGAVLLVGLGASLITYYGLAPFRPVRLPDAPPLVRGGSRRSAR
jgi:hypothetical protein